MKKKLNIGIIGKNFGYNVIYKSIEKDKSFNVLGFSCKNKKLNKELPNGIKIYSNWKNLILDKKIKAIVIATPPKLHKKIIEFAIKKRKHIFCDKPVTTSYSDISKLCKLLKNKKILHFTNYEFTNIEAFNFFKKKVLNKIIIKNIKIDWFIKIPKKKRSDWKNKHSLGGGNFFNYICHTLYYLENLFGNFSIIDTKIKKSKNDFYLNSKFFIKKKNINVLFNFKTIGNKSKIEPLHEIKIITKKDDYLLKTQISNLQDQFFLKKNDKFLFKPNKITNDFRVKPTYINLKKFKNAISQKKDSHPNFFDAKRIHFLIKSIKSFQKKNTKLSLKSHK
jgi:predicted dehydrogenase